MNAPTAPESEDLVRQLRRKGLTGYAPGPNGLDEGPHGLDMGDPGLVPRNELGGGLRLRTQPEFVLRLSDPQAVIGREVDTTLQPRESLHTRSRASADRWQEEASPSATRGVPESNLAPLDAEDRGVVIDLVRRLQGTHS